MSYHDLRTAITPMLGFSSWRPKKTRLPSPACLRVEIASSSAQFAGVPASSTTALALRLMRRNSVTGVAAILVIWQGN